MDTDIMPPRSLMTNLLLRSNGPLLFNIDGVLLTSIRFYAAQVMYKVVITLDKVAILLLYYRIFNVHRGFRIASHCVNAFIITSGLAFIIATIFQCTPVSGVWSKGYEKMTCINSKNFWISYAALNILTDVILLVMPIRQVSRLQISLLDKVGLSLVFCTGLFFTATTIARTTTLAASANNKDATWGPIPATVWSVIEPNVGIIAACLPTLRRPFSFLVRPFIRESQLPRESKEYDSRGRSSGARSNDRMRAFDDSNHHSAMRLSDRKRDIESSGMDKKAPDYDLNSSWIRNSSEEDDMRDANRDSKEPIYDQEVLMPHAKTADTYIPRTPSQTRKESFYNEKKTPPQSRSGGTFYETTTPPRKLSQTKLNQGIYVEREVSRHVSPPVLRPQRSSDYTNYSHRYAPNDMPKEDAQREYYLRGLI